jgi:hypothetical protein
LVENRGKIEIGQQLHAAGLVVIFIDASCLIGARSNAVFYRETCHAMLQPPAVFVRPIPMTDAFVNKNDYGLILLRDSYDDALAESEEMYDKECERKGNRTPKIERTTRYLLGIKENVLSGQVGLYVPPRHNPIEIPSSAVTAPHLDNPLWVVYDFINGAPKMVIGALPFGHFGVGRECLNFCV